jgi:acetyl esterase/lipase
MRGIISPKLSNFIVQVNIAAEEAKVSGVKLSPNLVRGNLNKLAVFIGQGPELAYVKDEVFKKSTHNIPVRIYSPTPDESLPVVIHYHGGGHMCGSIELYDAISRKISKAGPCIVIAVEYRLAPEHPYPAGIDDCQYVLENYEKVLEQIKYNQQLMIAGDSAGGAICTTLASNNLYSKTIKIDKQILIYPSVDYTMKSASIEENGTGFLLETNKVNWYFDNYFQQNESKKEVSPLYMPMDENMPKTIIFTAGCDPLRDEGILYGEALIRLGVEVEQYSFEGMIHAYMLLDSMVTQECDKTYQLIGEFIKK